MSAKTALTRGFTAALIAAASLTTAACDGDPSLSHAGSPAPRTAPISSTSSTPRATGTTESVSITDALSSASRDAGSSTGKPLFVKEYGPISFKIEVKGAKNTLQKGKEYRAGLYWFDQQKQDSQPNQQGVILYDSSTTDLKIDGSGGFDWTVSTVLPALTYAVDIVITPADKGIQGNDWSSAVIVRGHPVQRVSDPAAASAAYDKAPS